MTELREYQKKAVDEIRKCIASGKKRIILQSATGSGKTAIFCHIMKGVHEKRKKCIMVVRGSKLVHQASSRLSREGLPHGVFQANNTRGEHHDIFVCSIDTLFSRGIAPDADLIVIDECHLTTGKKYSWLLEQEKYKNSCILGVSATPFAEDGLEKIGEVIIYPVKIRDLIDQGYLVGGKYTAPFKPDLKGVRRSGEDYNLKDLERHLDAQLEGMSSSLLSSWYIYGKGNKSILYAVSIAHAKYFKSFLEKQGIRCAEIFGNTPNNARNSIISGLISGEIDVIVSVGVLITGVDIPELNTLFVCRPTRSYNLHIQMLGRGTRIAPDKDHFRVVDLASNIHRFGPIEFELEGELKPTKVKSNNKALLECPNCFYIWPKEESDPLPDGRYKCPECGHIFSIGGDRPETEDDITADKKLTEIEFEPWEEELPDLISKAKKYGYKKGWIFHTIKRKYGEEASARAWYRVRKMKKWPVVDRPKNTKESSMKFWQNLDRYRVADYIKMPPEDYTQDPEDSSDSD